MKKPFVLLFIFQFIVSFTLIGQGIANTEFVKGSLSDVGKIAKAYLTPMEKSLNAIGSDGIVFINHTNKGKLTLSVGLNLVMAFAPMEAKTFNVNDLGLQEFEPADPNLVYAQTFSGNNSSIELQTRRKYKTPSSVYPFYKENSVFSLSTVSGQNRPLFLPFISVSISKNNWNISVRALPPVKISEKSIKISSIGTSAQATVFSIASLSKDNCLHIDLITGLQFSKIAYNVGIVPDETKTGISLQSNNGPYNNQFLNIYAYSLPLKVELIQKIDKVSVFAGGGYNFWFSGAAMKGEYPVYYADPSDTFKIIVKDFEDPFEYRQSSTSFFADIGMGYRFKRLSLISNLTFSNYRTLNFGATFHFP
jgi:hypothetical protein